jgi:trehalose 6-phosphate phosphatase
VRPLLDPSQAPVLAGLAAPDVLLAFDFDGTLAPIVDDPARAELPGETRRLLVALCARRPCAVISGRARQDLVHRLRGLPLRSIIGNHGQEGEWPAADPAPLQERVRALHAAIAARLPALPGFFLEDKGLSLSLHHRRADPALLAGAAAFLAGLPGARIVPGKEVFNVVPEGAAHKGDGLRRAVSACGCRTALYVGDDDTDEDAFALGRSRGWVTVRVEESPRSRAAWFLRRQGEIDALLAALLLQLGP